LPTRYLKPGIRDSARIEAIQFPDAEILYYRLIVSVDDFGRTDARPLMVKALCFPIRLRATADKCMQWLQDLVNSGLISVYEVNGKSYLQVTKWDNKPRAEHSKYPNPRTDADKCMQMLPVNREPLTVNRELKPKTNTLFANANGAWDEFWEAYPRKTAKQVALKAWKRVLAGDVPVLMAAIEAQSVSEQWQRGVIPHPATWLNQRRWEDETIVAGQDLGQCMFNRNGERGTLPQCANPGAEERDRLIYCKQHQHLHGERKR
jgi:hypothetical protein